MRPALVVQTVTGRTTAELRTARDAADADMVELRTDGVVDLDVAGALQGRRLPVIFTCRARSEGGYFDGHEDERLSILSQAIRLGAEFVDVEWRSDRRRLSRARAGQLVLSHHDFSGTPADLAGRVRAMQAERPDVLKISVTAGRLTDCLTLRRAVEIDTPHVAIAMGNAGQPSRLCPGLFGSLWTYGGTAAPGQIDVRDLRHLFRLGSQRAATQLCGVAAASATATSRAVVLHNAMAVAAGVDLVCLPLESDDAVELLHVAGALGLSGIALSDALGRDVLRLQGSVTVDERIPRLGTLNTLRRTDGRWEGCVLAPDASDPDSPSGDLRLVGAQFEWWTSGVARPDPVRVAAALESVGGASNVGPVHEL